MHPPQLPLLLPAPVPVLLPLSEDLPSLPQIPPAESYFSLLPSAAVSHWSLQPLSPSHISLSGTVTAVYKSSSVPSPWLHIYPRQTTEPDRHRFRYISFPVLLSYTALPVRIPSVPYIPVLYTPPGSQSDLPEVLSLLCKSCISECIWRYRWMPFPDTDYNILQHHHLTPSSKPVPPDGTESSFRWMNVCMPAAASSCFVPAHHSLRRYLLPYTMSAHSLLCANRWNRQS